VRLKDGLVEFDRAGGGAHRRVQAGAAS
jgi:hypothetical protein